MSSLSRTTQHSALSTQHFRVVLIDNYDSFTYNLLQYLEELGASVDVVRNDAATGDGIAAKKPTHLVISPGPGTPERAGISIPLVRELAGKVPILGVCLGHQAIAVAFGGRWVHAPRLMHGKTSPVRHDGGGIFRSLPDPFEAARYHSLAVDEATLPDCLEVTAWAEEPSGARVIMGMRHKTLPVWGVQFHPESFMTPEGKKILANFLEGRL